MTFSSILIFTGTVILIELAIEALRFLAEMIIHNTWPAQSMERFLAPQNNYLFWILNTTETLTIVALLYLGYSSYFIILVTFLLISGIKELSNYFIK